MKFLVVMTRFLLVIPFVMYWIVITIWDFIRKAFK